VQRADPEGRGYRGVVSTESPPAITITVRLFASLREAAGTDRVELRLPAATPAGAVWSHLPSDVGAEGPPDGVRYAVNHEWSLPGAPLRDGDEVALVLPVSGG
jgi:molybdopterin synthase sulfur carrier subunit